jgi:hypothetical protein
MYSMSFNVAGVRTNGIVEGNFLSKNAHRTKATPCHFPVAFTGPVPTPPASVIQYSFPPSMLTLANGSVAAIP